MGMCPYVLILIFRLIVLLILQMFADPIIASQRHSACLVQFILGFICHRQDEMLGEPFRS